MRKLKNWRLIKFEKERVSSQWDSPPPWKRETSAPASNFALRRRRCKKETRGDLATVQPEKDFCFIGADIHSRCFFLFYLLGSARETKTETPAPSCDRRSLSACTSASFAWLACLDAMCLPQSGPFFILQQIFKRFVQKFFQISIFQNHSLDIFIEIRS